MKDKTFFFIFLIILAFAAFNCSSAQVIKSSNNQDIKTDEAQTELEKERTKDLIGYINNLKLDDFSEKFIIKQIRYKDQQLKLKDSRIKSLSTLINAYQSESTKAVEKCENKQDEFIKEQKDCLIDAGYGKSFKMIIYVGLGVFVLFIVYFAMKKGLFGLIKGG